MINRRRLGILLAVGILLVLAAATVVNARSERDSAPAEALPVLSDDMGQQLPPCTAKSEPVNFPVYSAGLAVDGERLVHVERVCYGPLEGETIRPNYTTLIYGTCDASSPEADSAGCSPPLEIQTWSSCDRGLFSYQGTSGIELPTINELSATANVPSMRYDDGDRLELYADGSTIVVFSQDEKLLDQAISRLAELPSDQPPSLQSAEMGSAAELTPASPASLKGETPCQA